ncbi:MAG: protein kinase domain-containing protein [Gammaproteobacteria bacterium]
MGDPIPPDPDRTETALEGMQVLAEGRVLAGRYRIAGLVGVGGMGMVYRALDERLGLDVALKVLRPERLVQHQRMIERFQQELILARQVSHRNVVRIHDIGQDGDVHFLTMDLVRGRSLKEILEAHGPLDAARAVAIGHDLANALAAAHRENVVHRDLKPSNVLVDEEGRAYITDFGVARSLNTAGLTMAGNVIGTPDYLSPEQARGADVDGRTDIYALGLILFEMLSGKLPFSGESFDEVLAARAFGEPRTLSELGVDAPAWLQAIVETCLQRDPADRYDTAAELAEDLMLNQAGRRGPRFRRLTVAALVLAGAIPLIGAIALLVWPDRETDEPVAQAPAEPVIAILPLANETGQEDLAWVSTGIAEMLAQNLAESAGLQVADSLRVFRTLEDLKLPDGPLPDRDLRQMAELLDVGRVLTGQVREAGGRIRIGVSLANAVLPGLPAQHFDVEGPAGGNVFALVQTLSNELRAALELPASAPPAEPALSGSPAALSAYAEGVTRLTRGDSIGAANALETAVQEDADFPAAWVRLADAYEKLGQDDEALEAARRAVEMAESGRIGFAARAREASLSGDLARAVEILRELVARYPRDVEARLVLAETLGDHGHLEEAAAALEKIVAGQPNHPRAWFLLGKFAILRGDSSAAADDYLVRALIIQNRLNNVQGQADVHNAFGIAYDQLGRIGEAEREYRRAVELRRQAGDERGVAASLANLASIQRLQGDDEAARAGLEEALLTLERIGDKRATANLHNEIGYFEEQKGNYRAALDEYRDALRIRRELGDQRATAESYNNVGFAYCMLGEYDNASVYTEQARDLFESTGNSEGVMSAQQTLGLLETARGDWEAAQNAYLAALETSRELGSEGAEAVSLGNLGRIAQFQGRYAASAASYAQALALLDEAADRRGLTEFTLFEASLVLELGQLDEAAVMLDRAQTWLDTDANSEQHSMLERLRGAWLLASGDAPAAREALQRAMDQASTSGGVVARLESTLGLAEVELALGEPDAARERLLEVRREVEKIRHTMLLLRSGELLAHAESALGRHKEAEGAVRAALRRARDHSPYAGTWRLHSLLGEILKQTGRADAALAERRAAIAEIARLKENLDSAAADSFTELDDVRKLAQETTLDPAA